MEKKIRAIERFSIIARTESPAAKSRPHYPTVALQSLPYHNLLHQHPNTDLHAYQHIYIISTFHSYDIILVYR